MRHSVMVGVAARNGRTSSHSWIGFPPAPGAADSSPATDVGTAAKSYARTGAPFFDDRGFFAAEFGVVGEDVRDPSKADLTHLADRRAAGDVEHRTVDTIEMLADFLDEQFDVGEVGLMRARRKAEDAEGLLGPIDPVGCEVEFPIADVSQGFNFLEAELTPGRRRFRPPP